MKIYRYRKTIQIEYKTEKDYFINNNVNNELWYCETYHALVLFVDKKWFEKIDNYYDGHTMKGWCIFGIGIMKTYSYNSNNVDDWEHWDDNDE